MYSFDEVRAIHNADHDGGAQLAMLQSDSKILGKAKALFCTKEAIRHYEIILSRLLKET